MPFGPASLVTQYPMLGIRGFNPKLNRDIEAHVIHASSVAVSREHRWRDEAVKAGRNITRIAVAYEAGRDGFWLARWLRAMQQFQQCILVNIELLQSLTLDAWNDAGSANTDLSA